MYEEEKDTDGSKCQDENFQWNNIKLGNSS